MTTEPEPQATYDGKPVIVLDGVAHTIEATMGDGRAIVHEIPGQELEPEAS
jgi:hypothetical protein